LETSQQTHWLTRTWKSFTLDCLTGLIYCVLL